MLCVNCNFFFFFFFNECEHRMSILCPFSSLHPLGKGDCALCCAYTKHSLYLDPLHTDCHLIWTHQKKKIEKKSCYLEPLHTDCHLIWTCQIKKIEKKVPNATYTFILINHFGLCILYKNIEDLVIQIPSPHPLTTTTNVLLHPFSSCNISLLAIVHVQSECCCWCAKLHHHCAYFLFIYFFFNTNMLISVNMIPHVKCVKKMMSSNICWSQQKTWLVPEFIEL